MNLVHEGEGVWRELGHVVHKVVAERGHNAFARSPHFGHRGSVVARLRRTPAVCDGQSIRMQYKYSVQYISVQYTLISVIQYM